MNKSYFKSLEYSKKSSKSWGLLSISFIYAKKYNELNDSFRFFLKRTILYIEKDKHISQIGESFFPVFSFKYLKLFIFLFFSKKTLGDYLNQKYENIEIKILENTKCSKKYSSLLNKEDYDCETRLISIASYNIHIYVKEHK